MSSVDKVLPEPNVYGNALLDKTSARTCNLCHAPASLICARCRDYYCSHICQKLDWKQHRYICFPLPNLIDGGEYGWPANTPALQIKAEAGIGRKTEVPFQELKQETSGAAQQQHGGSGPVKQLKAANNNQQQHGMRNGRNMEQQLGPQQQQQQQPQQQQQKNQQQQKFEPKELKQQHQEQQKPQQQKQQQPQQQKYEPKEQKQQHQEQQNPQQQEQQQPQQQKYEPKEQKQQHQEQQKPQQQEQQQPQQQKYEPKEQKQQHQEHQEQQKPQQPQQQKLQQEKKQPQEPQQQKLQQQQQQHEQQQQPSAEGLESKNEMVNTENMEQMQKLTDPLEPFEIQTLQKDAKNFEMMILDDSNLDSGYFGAIPIEHIPNLGEVQHYLKTYKDNEEHYEPKLGEYVLAKFENAYYRAIVAAVPAGDDDLYTVTYVDYTNEGQVSPAEIRKYPKDLKTPCHTMLCLLDDLPENMSEELMATLKKELNVGASAMVDSVVGIFEMVALVKMENVVKNILKS